MESKFPFLELRQDFVTNKQTEAKGPCMTSGARLGKEIGLHPLSGTCTWSILEESGSPEAAAAQTK